ncbi:MAG: hypothetical protein JXB49_25860 [Bacteroidales bacterium]|nr:hypothetical protein [Bacteroidales bacterium]
MRRICLIISFLSYSLACFSQLVSLEDIDLARVHQKKIRQFIHMQLDNNILNLSDVQGSSKVVESFDGFSRMENTFLVNEDLKKVWEKYLTVSPTESWNGRIISFGLLFSKNTGSVLYNDDDEFDGVDTSQVLYVNLKLLGFYNLPVGFEITQIDTANRIIAFSYIEGGKVQGIQRLHFTSTTEGFTQIEHSSTFKSDSRFRDRYLYPHFHEKAITEFHRNVMEDLLLEDKTSSDKKGKADKIHS